MPLVALYEIHKYKDWKNYLKGIYDQFHQEYQFLISGSGRLDIYQKGGGSLAVGFRKLRNGNQKILIAPACQWLAMLP